MKTFTVENTIQLNLFVTSFLLTEENSFYAVPPAPRPCTIE